jgi:hypothetical protein
MFLAQCYVCVIMLRYGVAVPGLRVTQQHWSLYDVLYMYATPRLRTCTRYVRYTM